MFIVIVKSHEVEVKNKQSTNMKRSLEQVTETEISSWLSALPLSQYGFNLNKAEFQDALSLRYNKKPKNLPAKCVCVVRRLMSRMH